VRTERAAEARVAPYRHIGDDRGCDNMLTIGATPLLRAAKTFDVPAMKLLVAHKARLGLAEPVGHLTRDGGGGLRLGRMRPARLRPGIPHYVTPDVEQKSIEALTVLLDAGADVNQRTTAERGATTAAADGALRRRVLGLERRREFLVERGAKIDVADTRGLTRVDAALGKGRRHGRGQTVEVYKDTADLIVETCKQQSGCDLAMPDGPPNP
jgi:hypothetical protein